VDERHRGPASSVSRGLQKLEDAGWEDGNGWGEIIVFWRGPQERLWEGGEILRAPKGGKVTRVVSSSRSTYAVRVGGLKSGQVFDQAGCQKERKLMLTVWDESYATDAGD